MVPPSLHDGWTTLARLPALRRLLVDVPGSLLSSHLHRHSLPCPCLRCTRQPGGSWLGFGSLVLVCRWPEGLRRQGSMWRETVGAAAVERGRRRGRWWRRWGLWQMVGWFRSRRRARCYGMCFEQLSIENWSVRPVRRCSSRFGLPCREERPARLPCYSPLEACRSAQRTRTPGKADISSENGKAKSSISPFHKDLKWM